jgi:hypothetical protein
MIEQPHSSASSPDARPKRAAVALGCGLAALLISTPARAQLDEHCTVSILNRTANVKPDGSWALPNVPANVGQVRARATCIVDGATISGQSDFFTIPPNGVVEVPEIILGAVEPVPASLIVGAPSTTLTAAGATMQLAVSSTFSDGSVRDVTSATAGTNYTISNAAIATVSAGGLVTALTSGTVVISALNEGALGLIRIQVILSGDTDGDGIPDDVELANGLSPTNAVDALEDADGDGLTNKQELIDFGTNFRASDTDGDGISDGEETTPGADGFVTNPLLVDTDGDGIRDGLEVATGSDPTDPNSLNLAAALDSIDVSPAHFVIVFNTIAGDAFRQLAVTGDLRDGTTINLTSTARGTNYTSSDLTICNFGAEPGRVFAGNSGTCTITVANSGFSDTATGEIRTFAPTPLSFVNTPGFANNVDVNGDFAFVAAGSAGLQIVDVSDRTAPSVVASLDTPGNANDVKVVGNLAYVADGSAGLQIIDVMNPLALTLLGSVDTPGDASDVAVSGDLVFIADGPSGLQIVGVANPSTPDLLGSSDTPGTAKGVDVVGNLAVVADGATGIQVIDVSNPAAPVIRGSADTSGDARDVVVKGTTAYIADFTGSFLVADISTPTAPQIVGATTQSLGGILMDVAFREPFVLGADVFFVNGVPIVNVDVPANPLVRARLDFTARDDDGTGIAVDGSFVYLTASRGIAENGTTGDTRLYIGQYLALEDLAGLPPTVNITAPAPGSTFVEGETIPIKVDATDDVTVTSVEFLVGGSTVFTDTAAPYEFNIKAPTGVRTLTLGAQALDLGGNTGVALGVVINVIPDPLTTVVGTVVDTAGNPVAGASVTVLGLSAPTAADGTFSIPGVPTASGSLRATASFTAPDGAPLTGVSAAFAPVRGGTTGVGVITLRGGVAVIRVFDAAADFSLASNPNGPWTYGATQVLGTITPFTVGDTTSGLPGFSLWHIAPGITESLGAPVVAINVSNTTHPRGIRPGELAYHPGPDSFGVIRWTAPAAGQFDIKALFTGGDLGDTEVFVLRGATPLFCGDINGFGDVETLRRGVTLAAGETIDFVVGNAGSFFFDTTLINVTIFETTGPSPASLLEDNFNCENGRQGALNYAGFANWNVTRGSVDLLGNSFFDFLPQNGLFLDLDGSSLAAGLLESKQTFALDPGTYELQFDLGGNRERSGDTSSVTVGLGSVFTESFTLDFLDPMRTVTRSISIATPTSGALAFDHAGGDNTGLLLDDVRLRRVTCTQAPTGLVGWWSGDGNTNDLAGTNHGTLQNGATFAPGLSGQAFSFDGVNDFVQVPDSDLWAFGSGDFSVDLWVNFRSVRSSGLASPGNVFIGNDEGGGSVNKWFFALGGGFLNFHINSPLSGPLFLAQTLFSPIPNRWYHLAVTRLENKYTIYIDGVPTAPETNTTVIPNPNAPLTIGQAEGLGFMDGLIDEVEIYNRALSATEIQDIFQAGSAGKCRPSAAASTTAPLLATRLPIP